ncbi:hypothetical protein [Sphingomicrobium arenosum]|uniref:hypothetical protein n=1 Tax=Sphingomicrobium arenosum TaxID=2233861 RepID=UPI00224051F4|nr:hypothetical protein [Sphingomicrobium arenosum]
MSDSGVTPLSMYRSQASRTDTNDRSQRDRDPIRVTIPTPTDPVTAHLCRAFDAVKCEPLPEEMRLLLAKLN